MIAVKLFKIDIVYVRISNGVPGLILKYLSGFKGGIMKERQTMINTREQNRQVWERGRDVFSRELDSRLNPIRMIWPAIRPKRRAKETKGRVLDIL